MATQDLNIQIKTTNDGGSLAFARDLSIVWDGLQKAASAVADFSKELLGIAEAGAEVTQMRNHFNTMNGGITIATEKFNQLKNAASGNLNDKEILQYINKLDELGYSSEQSAQMLDLAERKSDELGVTIEDATTKMTRFIETGKGKGLFQLGISVADVEKEMMKLSGSTSAQIKAMDAEDAKILRSTAVFNLYGNSIDEINKKQKGTDDILKSITVAFENAKIKIGEFIADTIGRLAESLGLTNEKMVEVIVASGLIVTAIITISVAVMGLVLAFQALNISTGGLLSIIGVIVVAATALIGLGIAYSTTSTSIEEWNTKIKDTTGNVEKYGNKLSDITIILKGYHAELNNQKLSSSEQEQYNQALTNMASTNPTLIQQIKDRKLSEDELKVALEGTRKETENLYNSNNTLLQSQKFLATKEMTTEQSKLTEELQKQQIKLDDVNKSLQTGEIIVTSYSRECGNQSTVVKANGDEMNALATKQAGLVIAMQKTKDKLSEVSISLVKTSIAGFDLKTNMAGAFNSIINSAIYTQGSTNTLAGTFKNLGMAGVASIFGITEKMLENKKVAESMNKAWALALEGKFSEAAAEFQNTIKLSGDVKKTNNYNPNSKTSKGKTQTEETPMTPSEVELSRYEKWLEIQQRNYTLTSEGIKIQQEHAKTLEEIAYQEYILDEDNKVKHKAWQDYKKLVEETDKTLEDFYNKQQIRQEFDNKLKQKTKELEDNIDKAKTNISDTKEEQQITKLPVGLKKEDAKAELKYKKEVERIKQITELYQGQKEALLDIAKVQLQLDKTGNADKERNKNQEKWNTLLSSTVDLVGGLFGSLLAGGAGAADAFKNFLKGIVNAFITSVQAMLFAAESAAAAKGITSFGLTLITDLPLIAAAWVGLELAKGIVGGLEKGGDFGAGMYLVGERGPELAMMGGSGHMVNNKDLSSILNPNSSNSMQSTPIYISANMDGLTFMKTNYPKYKSYKNSVRV